MRNTQKIMFALGFFFLSIHSFAHSFSESDSLKAPNDWFNLDPVDNGAMGVSTHKAYELLNGEKAKKTIIVAVIDSGVDIEHEDLDGKIWVNEGEIPGNGIDDDNNGYVDDVNGWNFIGGPNNTNVEDDTYELTREYVRLRPFYDGIDSSDVKRRDREEYAYWLSIKKELEENQEEAEMNHRFTSVLYTQLRAFSESIKETLDKDDITESDLKSLDTDDPELKEAVSMISQLFFNFNEPGTTLNTIMADLKEAVDYYESQALYAYNPEFNPRPIVGDDPENYREKYYGNNDVIGPDAGHGTHVAGIIAANRTNQFGIIGIAEHVLIMPIRAVPNGDERDKDIANAIYYAVDNGADIINMSFGKSYSPGKKHVDKAVRYAGRKGVLLVHAAGNSGKEVQRDNNFPNKWLGKRREASNWIEVGASAWKAGENLPGRFSNYSAEAVDLFAPGVDVFSTIPDDSYKANSGTSMAAPVVSGVAALILAYYPRLTPEEIKSILKQSVYDHSGQMVIKPGNDDEEVPFGALSITGGVINAYQALKLADSLSPRK